MITELQIKAAADLEDASRSLWDCATEQMIEPSLFEDGTTIRVPKETWQAFVEAVLPFVDHRVESFER